MIVHILDYEGNNTIGSFDALSCTEHRKLDEYRTATIELLPKEYKNNKDLLKVNSMISYSATQNTSGNNYKFLFRITSISATEKRVTIEADDYRNVFKMITCSYYAYDTLHQWSLHDLILTINGALKNNSTYTSIMQFQDIQGIPTNNNSRPFVQDNLSGEYVAYNAQGFDFFSRTLYDIIYEIQSVYSVYLIWQARTVYFVDEPSNMISNPELPYYRTSVNATNYSIKYDADSFKAALRVNYDVETNNREEKISDKRLSGVFYNDWYKSQFPSYTENLKKAECRKLMTFTDIKSDIEWDRRIKLNINLYKYHHTENPQLTKFDITYDKTKFPQGPGRVELCNVLGENIGYCNVSITGNSKMYLNDGTTEIGSCNPNGAGSSWTGEIKFRMYCNYFGIWCSLYGDLLLYIDGKKEEIDIYDCVKNKLGTCSLMGTNETGWTINYIQAKDGEVTAIPGSEGHVQSMYNQAYDTYYQAYVEDIADKAYMYINDYTVEDTKSIQATPMLEDNTGIGPGMSLHLISDVYELGDSLLVESCDVDMITHRSSNITTGWKRKTLKDLK